MSRDCPSGHETRGRAAEHVVLILLDTLSPAERRDLANSLLRAAWCATLEQTRVLLLDALVEIDHNIFGNAA